MIDTFKNALIGAAAGAGAGGGGGIVTIVANSASALNLNSISATGNGTSGKGGTIDISNNGFGGINIVTGNYNVAGSGDGGHLSFNANSGSLSSPPSPRTASVIRKDLACGRYRQVGWNWMNSMLATPAPAR